MENNKIISDEDEKKIRAMRLGDKNAILWGLKCTGLHYRINAIACAVMYNITDDDIIFDRKVKGANDVCMSKDYIITLERDRERDPMDESTVRRDISKCPRTVFLYDYAGNLLKIVDVGMPIMRIAAGNNSNTLYIIGGNPDYVLAKCEL